jgi:hypothetical protein
VLKQRHSKNSIHNVKNGIFTRGVLVDIPRLKGVPYLEPGTPIYVEDLEAWEKKAGVKVEGLVTRSLCARACRPAARRWGRGFAAEQKGAARRDSTRLSSPG